VNGQESPRQGIAGGGGTCGEFCTTENLTTAEADAANILAGLVSVNGHLNSACNAPLVTSITGSSCALLHP
jgi:hypothetical protein